MASMPLFYDRKLGVSSSNIPALVTFADGASYNLVLLTAEALLQENFQAQKSFTDDIYLVTFGQQLSNIKLAGYQDVAPTCSGAGGSKSSDIVKFYQERRVTVSGTPVTVTFNKLTLKGIVIALDIQPIRADGMTGYRYEINLIGQMPVASKDNRNSGNADNTGSSTSGTGAPPTPGGEADSVQDSQTAARTVDTTNPNSHSAIRAAEKGNAIVNDQSNIQPPPIPHPQPLPSAYDRKS